MIKHIAEGIVNRKITASILMRQPAEMFASFLPLLDAYLNSPILLDIQIVWEYDFMAIEGILSSDLWPVFHTMNVLSPCQTARLKLEIEKLLNTKDT
jgi:hypothetical protein